MLGSELEVWVTRIQEAWGQGQVQVFNLLLDKELDKGQKQSRTYRTRQKLHSARYNKRGETRIKVYNGSKSLEPSGD